MRLLYLYHNHIYHLYFVIELGLVNYIEAVVTYCEDNDIEIETVSKLISKPLKEKIKYQAQSLNYMKKTSRGILPL